MLTECQGCQGISEKVSKTTEGKEKTTLSVKKGIESSNKLIQSLAVGAKPLVALPNWFGTGFQAFINSGGFYKKMERNFRKFGLDIAPWSPYSIKVGAI
jgi:hypothetical protein